MRFFDITTNFKTFSVNAISAAHARQLAERDLEEGERIVSVL
jgi:hypothetical protein